VKVDDAESEREGCDTWGRSADTGEDGRDAGGYAEGKRNERTTKRQKAFWWSRRVTARKKGTNHRRVRHQQVGERGGPAAVCRRLPRDERASESRRPPLVPLWDRAFVRWGPTGT